jgi:hypothetical protein
VTISPAPALDEGASNQVNALAQGAALLGLGGGAKGLATRFDRYLITLTSVDTAAVLYRERKIRDRIFRSNIDEKTGGWRPPHGPSAWVRSALNWIVGMPDWSPPTPAHLPNVLHGLFQIDTASLRNTTTISIMDTDPAFGMFLLSSVLETADRIVREHEQKNLTEKIDVIQRQLAAMPNADLRQAMANSLASEVLKQSFAVPGAPFSMTRVTGITASSRPVSPRTSLTLILCIFLGVFSGSAFAILWRWDSPPRSFGGVPWNTVKFWMQRQGAHASQWRGRYGRASQ